MTDSTFDLDKLERLEREATPGPWRWADGYKSTYGDAAYTLAGYQDMGILSCDGIFNSPRDCDEELIVALRNAAPAMIAELRALRARVAELERDARLGAVVREVVATGGVGSDEPDQLDWYAQSLADDHSMFGAAVIRAIADALRAEEEG